MVQTTHEFQCLLRYKVEIEIEICTASLRCSLRKKALGSGRKSHGRMESKISYKEAGMWVL